MTSSTKSARSCNPRVLLTLLVGVSYVFAGSVATAQAPASASARTEASAAAARQLTLTSKPFTGDFDQMLQRRMIRVYSPYSRSLYYVDKGVERGLAAELVRDFERWVNQKYAQQLGKRPITVYIVAATRDQLLSDLNEGRADIAVGNLTVTEERLKQVDFVSPDDKIVNKEIVVTGPGAPVIASVDDLSGKTIHVRKSSSYYESLTALNDQFRAAGKAEVTLAPVPDALEDEDMLEMTNAGLLQMIVVDDWKAKLWAQVLPQLKAHDDVVLREPTKKGWAIRKNSPQLAAVLTDFYANWVEKQGVMAYRHKRLMASVKSLNDPRRAADQQRFQQMIQYFEKYGKEYQFDPLLLAAQGYQESTLDQTKKSRVGAVGVMQLMPATGQSLGVGDINVTEANIHCGAKYMDQLMTKYFKDAKFDEQNRTLFAFASYNAGPANIARMRAEAMNRGLNPDKWFNNVELITAEKIGIETTTYVRNIFKYYVSYKLTQDAQASAEKLQQQVAPL